MHRIYVEALHAVPTADELAVRTSAGTHVVLQFAPVVAATELARLVTCLGEALPEHRVFLSGSHHVTVMPALSRARVREMEPAIRAAVTAYRETCRDLAARYTRGTLPDAWATHEHGEHVRLRHADGQIVEAPLSAACLTAIHVDPYFFAEFVRSTPAHELVAALLVHDFHDALRMLEVLGEE
ncbi:MAG TPA: hypothetical protein VK427_14300 [Kofleriaceae bacterium]|nr:hypothetical protein [Kofleriaceae bacterium]